MKCTLGMLSAYEGAITLDIAEWHMQWNPEKTQSTAELRVSLAEYRQYFQMRGEEWIISNIAGDYPQTS